MAKRRLTELLESSYETIRSLSGSALRTAYKSAAAAVRGRRRAFEKAGKLTGLPERYRKGVASLASFESLVSDNDPRRTEKIEDAMRTALGEHLGYLRNKMSRYLGYEEVISARAEHVGRKLGIHFKSNEEYERFGKFMDDMQVRLKGSWKPNSDFAVSMFKQAQRLNLNTTQFEKNFEYWRDHLEDLKEMDPIEGRNRELRASDYLKKANLETIHDYYADPENAAAAASKKARMKVRKRRKKR